MPTVNTSEINFDTFTTNYIPVDPSGEPEECNLPALPSLDIPLLPRDLTTVDEYCRVQLQVNPPVPPFFPPRIQLPQIPCPEGSSFSSSVSITGTGSASGSISLALLGGPCSFDLVGGGNIFVPPIPCPDGMDFSGSINIAVEGNGSSTKDANGNPGPISIQLIGGPCDWRILGGGTIVIPSPSSGGGSGNDVAADCLDCTATCCDVRTNIENQYATLGTTPQKGDIVNVCVAVYEVVGNPNPTSTCDMSCPDISGALVIDFVVDSITYYARQISCKCIHTPFFVVLNPAGDHITCLTGTLQYEFGGSDVGIINLNTSLSINMSDNVWLELTVAGYTVAAAQICTDNALGPSGVSFDPTATPWTSGSTLEQDSSVPPVQTYARYPIASLASSISTQQCYNNLVAADMVIVGKAAVYPTPN
jgi:hypothetical protein